MSISIPNNAGCYLRNIHETARWARDGEGAVGGSEAAELEDTLQFLDGHNQLERLLPRLRDDMRARDSALAEARTGRFLADLGFQIVRWEPRSATGRLGDLLVKWKNVTPIFTEVKGPDWEAELSQELPMSEFLERKAVGKCVDGEAGPASPTQIPFKVIRDNVLPKLANDQPNLVAIVDNLRISPAMSRGPADWEIVSFFREPNTSPLGGILFLLVDKPVGRVRYISNFYKNASALGPCRLAEGVVAALTQRAARDSAMVNAEARRWSEDRQGVLEELAKKICAGTQAP